MNNYKNSFNNLINSYDKFSDLEFRLLLEELIKRGGIEAEEEYAIILRERGLSIGVRMNLIRVAGYIKSPLFLIPLKHIIDKEQNINLRKEAIIAIAKYNDKKALNILSDSLKRNKDKSLENIIKQEIGKIKQDNPVISLIPQFLKSTENKKAYTTILNVLCKIVTPSDAKTFIPFLNSEDSYIAIGSFKILCFTGDKTISNFILNFFEKSVKAIDCINKNKCEKLYEILTFLKQYISNNRETFDIFYKKSKEIYEKTADIRIKELILLMFIMGNKKDDISLIFDNESNFREFIIDNLKSDENSVDFLIEELNKDNGYKENIINILTTTEKGKKYLSENYKNFENQEKAIILNNVNKENYDEFKYMVRDALLSDNPIIIKKALEKIKENYDISVKDYLFNDKIKEKFRTFEELYIDTIVTLFPKKAFLFLFDIIKNGNTTLKKLKTYINKMEIILSKKPVIKIPKEFNKNIDEFLNILLRTNNNVLLTEFLSGFRNIYALDPESFSILNNFVEKYIARRKDKLDGEEKKELKKFIENIKTNKEFIDKIKSAEIKLQLFLQQENKDISLIEEIAEKFKFSFFIYRESIADKLRSFLLSNNNELINKTLNFLSKYPNLGFLLKKNILEIQRSDSFSVKANSKELLLSLPESLKIIIKFSDKENFSFFRDQLKIVFNEFDITDEGLPEKHIIYITDSRSLIENNESIKFTSRPVIILNRLSDGAMIKKYDGITFLPEYSLYRIVLQIIKELW